MASASMAPAWGQRPRLWLVPGAWWWWLGLRCNYCGWPEAAGGRALVIGGLEINVVVEIEILWMPWRRQRGEEREGIMVRSVPVPPGYWLVLVGCFVFRVEPCTNIGRVHLKAGQGHHSNPLSILLSSDLCSRDTREHRSTLALCSTLLQALCVPDDCLLTRDCTYAFVSAGYPGKKNTV